MYELKWSHAEKAVARRAFDLALGKKLETLVREAKDRAARIEEPSELWDLASWLTERRREIDRMYDLHLRNVPFLVIPDTNEPFVEFGPKEGHRGLIGLPILLAMRSVRWTPHGDFEFDFPHTSATETSNLLFHETNPIVQVMAGERKLDFTLDTGAVGTDLNPLFAEEFPDLISSGKKETNTITGVGETRDYESVLLPSVSLTVGGKAVILAPAHVSVAQGLGGVSMWAGNLGNDLLNQAHTITIDFRVMSLKLQ
jgi:hypothetical protein